MNDIETLELDLFVPGLPLTFVENLITVLALFPLAGLVWLLRDFSFIQEGFIFIFGIPALIILLVVRYFIAKRRFNEKDKLIVSENSVSIPSCLSLKGKESLVLEFSEIKQLTVNEIRGKTGKSKLNLVLSSSHGEFCLSGLAFDLTKVCLNLEQRGLKIEYQIYRPQVVLVSLWLFLVLVFTAVWLLVAS
jgi:hypothetical protein